MNWMRIENHRNLRCAVVMLAVMCLRPDVAGQAGAPDRSPAPPPRLFPGFEGTWLLDEQASTGRMSATPGSIVTIAITPTEISLTRTRKLPEQRSNPPDETPIRQVFRLDGTEGDADIGTWRQRGRFLLVSDALVFTTSDVPRTDGFNIVTDAYSLEGDVLIARRQLVAIRAPGYIATMQEPSNNHPHVFVYRRAPAAGQE